MDDRDKARSYNLHDGNSENDAGIKIVEKRDGITLDDWVIEAEKVFGSYGLVVLHANDDGKEIQHGWVELRSSIKKLHIERRRKAIDGIRKCHSKENRLYLYNINIIEENDVYAWFYDLVWRQNNQAILVETKEGEKRVIENFSGRWNKKRPYGYQVRKRLKGVLENVENSLLLTLSLSDKLIYPLIPDNSNLDVVSFSISKIGEWVRSFLQKFYHYQERRNIDWQFKGWVIEFQEKNNCGFPHVHIIFAGNWLGRIDEIQKLWGYGRADLTTKKDIQKKYPGKKIEGLRLANYLTKYVSKSSAAINDDGVHKGYAWLAFCGGRVFSIKHEKKKQGG